MVSLRGTGLRGLRALPLLADDFDPALRTGRNREPSVEGQQRCTEGLGQGHIGRIPSANARSKIPNSAQEGLVAKALPRPFPEVLDGLSRRRAIEPAQQVIPADDADLDVDDVGSAA